MNTIDITFGSFIVFTAIDLGHMLEALDQWFFCASSKWDYFKGGYVETEKAGEPTIHHATF
jgi:hypothetical protein